MKQTAALALMLALATPSAFAAALSSEEVDQQQNQPVRGTVQGEVKKVQPGSVIIEMEATQDSESKEARLTLHESTHMGPIQEGDLVVAYVTPGGTTTSIQPLDSRWYR